MRMHSRKKKIDKAYFTLVELVVALAVAGFIVLVTGTAAMSFWRTWDTASRLTVRLNEYRKIDTVMDTFVRNAIPFNWTDTENNNTTSDLLFDGQENLLFFTSIRRSYGNDNGALVFIRLKLENDELIADYSQFPRFPWLDQEDEDMLWTREVIARKVRSISFLYADRNSDNELEWEDNDWDREAKPYLPLAIRMTIVWEDGTEESWLRRTAGSGANSVFGDRMEKAQTNAQ